MLPADWPPSRVNSRWIALLVPKSWPNPFAAAPDAGSPATSFPR